MARSKWISFGAQQNLDRAAKATATTPTPIPVQTPADAKKFGLENFGNTCYANSVLQALYFCTPFRDLLLQDIEAAQPQNSSPIIPPTPSKVQPLAPVRRKSAIEPARGPGDLPRNVVNPIPSSPLTLFSALQSLFLHISTNPGDKGKVAPRAFIDKVKELNELFRGTQHQDAHEFLNFLLNQIVEEIEGERKQALNDVHTEDLSSSVQTLASRSPPTVANSSNSGTHPQDATLVHKLFEGVLTSETRCLTCETVSSRDESFLDLSIDIEQNSSVTACLRQFSASEMLCQKNKFFCDSCCDLQEAEKRMKIKTLPNVLALHLKRFKYQEDVGKEIKLAYRVAFPFELRLFNTVDDMDDADRLYNLFAIVVHIGTGPNSGHYISIIKTFGTWLVFDDENVYSITEGDIPKYFGDSNSGSAYVLYYQALDIDLPALGLRIPEPDVPPEAASKMMPYFEHPLPLHVHQAPVLPPGLDPVNPSEGEVDLPLSRPIDPSPTLLPPETLAGPLSIPDTPISLSIPPFPDLPPPESISAVKSSPITPLGFGKSLFNTIRRAPSLSATKANEDINHRRSATSPRPSMSVPSFVSNVDPEIPPPVPPLPAEIFNNLQQVPPPTPITIPYVKEPEKEEKEKEKSKAGGWFKKRKSLRAGDKVRSDTTPTVEVPPSPFIRGDDGQQATNWLSKPSESTPLRSQRRPLENGIAVPFDVNGLHPDSVHLKIPKHDDDRRLNGHDDTHSPGSGSSSPSSTSLLTTAVGGSTTQPSTSVSSTGSGPSLEFSPSRKSSNAPTSSDWVRSSFDHKKSSDLKTASSSAPSTISSPLSSTHAVDYKYLPPLPSTPKNAYTHRPSPSNGYTFVSEPEPMISKGKSRSTDNESASPAPGFSLPPHVPVNSASPPLSLATSAGANNSSGSNNSASSNLKRATRKLSLTAPMLGFGKRDKDRDKEKAREREKGRLSPSAFNVKF